MAVGAQPIVALSDSVVARLRAGETSAWIRAHDIAPVATPVQAAPTPVARRETVITPGKEGYLLIVPRIGVRAVVRQLEPDVFSGRNTPTLKRYGLGQVPYTQQLRNVSPGADGTTAITGHRTTSGAPFRHIDRLRPGDLIVVRKNGVEQQWVVESSAVVPPSAVTTIESRPGVKRLVLLACTPPFSARERLLVRARLQQETAAAGFEQTAMSPR